MGILSELKVQRFDGSLKNGIRVVLLYRESSPVTTSAILNSGSIYDPMDAFGMAHFIEHMIMNGSQKFPSKDVLAEHIESVGGAFGARTNQEFLIVDTEVSEKADYGKVVDIFDATLCNPLMDEKVFHNEKKIVIKEIQKSLSNPGQLQIKVGRELFFTGTPQEHEVLGNEKYINSLQYSEMIATHATLFDASRITFIAAGDITIEELVSHLNTLQFNTGNPGTKIILGDNGLKKEKIKTEFFNTTQTHFILGIPSPKNNTKEMTQLHLLGAIIAGGRSARLTKRLRYDKGLIYSIHTTRFGTSAMGEWGIQSDTSEDKMQEVITEIILEIKDLQKHGVKESELEFVKNKKIKSFRRNTQTSKDWVEMYMQPEAVESRSFDIETYISHVENTTTDDIKIIIDTYFSNDKWQLAMVGRTSPDAITLNW
ncbi:MAG: pitrilysin family protein [Candidatus Paceibacterota bacterium]